MYMNCLHRKKCKEMSLKEQYHTNHNVEHLLAPLLLIFWYNSFLHLRHPKNIYICKYICSFIQIFISIHMYIKVLGNKNEL